VSTLQVDPATLHLPGGRRTGVEPRSIEERCVDVLEPLVDPGRACELRDSEPGENAMNVKNSTPLGRRWTAAELRKLPPAQRDAIMEAAAALAEEDYRNDPQLTAFEAFGKDDLYSDSSSSDPR
jgi:hypothetical protein